MATAKATFTPASPRTPAQQLAALGGATRERKVVPEQVPGQIRLAPVSGTQRPVSRLIPNPETEPKVWVNVPRAFMLQGDDRIMYRYEAGQQDMPQSHANHSYAEANGVAPAKKPSGS